MIYDYLNQFMNIYWLRPETALWRTLDCLALRDIQFLPPIVDVGCGDGLFSFIRGGGVLSPEYDMFSQVGELDAFFERVDIYNHYDSHAIPPIVSRKPDYQIDLGLDHKVSLLKKALSLGSYLQVQNCDANKTLPLENSTYRTIFSNILYWLGNYKTTLREFHRILLDDGQVVLLVPNYTLKEYFIYQKMYVNTGDQKWQWLHLIDRGRSENIKLCQSYDQWQKDFDEAGFKVLNHMPYLSKTIVEVWDIGLRPVSPLLIEMANKLSHHDRLAIKKKWIAHLMPLVEPLCELNWTTDDEFPPAFHLFVLGKK